MRPITHIVIHTAAAGTTKPIDQSAETIRAYHKRKGWSDIGYHKVVRFDGSVEKGRPMEKPGAGVEGFNQKTVHVCFTGHGDLTDFTPEQKEAGVELVCGLLDLFNLVDEFRQNPMRVLGHRECYQFPGVKNTGKSCPGNKVSMRAFRLAVIAELDRRNWNSDVDADEGDE